MIATVPSLRHRPIHEATIPSRVVPKDVTNADVTLSDDATTVDWERLAVVFKRAPLGSRDPVALRRVFENSGVRCFAWAGGKVIGAGRAVTDGVRYAVIFDVVVLPEYQGQGIGTRIMDSLIGRTEAPNILLYAVPGKETFYRKFGFRKMTTAMARFENPQTQQQGGILNKMGPIGVAPVRVTLPGGRPILRPSGCDAFAACGVAVTDEPD